MRIGVRDATLEDMRFVRRLAVQSSLHGVPYGREISNRAVKARARESVRDLKTDEDTVILVAFEESSEKLMGYLILDLESVEGSTGERQTLIHDLAVHPRYWGTAAVGCLVREAARRTARAGFQYMIGEVSAHNERTFMQALKLGFELERLQIVMSCSEDGPEPMPGRPEEEKHYAKSRAHKHRQPSIPRTYEQARSFLSRNRSSDSGAGGTE